VVIWLGIDLALDLGGYDAYAIILQVIDGIESWTRALLCDFVTSQHMASVREHHLARARLIWQGAILELA
jgi:hypothetical protein